MESEDFINSKRDQAVRPITWEGEEDGHLVLLDQTLLPGEVRYHVCRDVESVWESIRSLRVRGAPAIGIAAAYGVCLGVGKLSWRGSDDFAGQCNRVIDYLATSRPTAINLFWALERMRGRAAQLTHADRATVLADLLAEARGIHDEDRASCHAIGRHGAPVVPEGARILTHCNTGSLATSEYGTALSVLFTAHDQGRSIHVFVDETRPLLQGARLTAWELQQRGIPCTLICDSMAAVVMRQPGVDLVITGADRIAANGDTANKVGTYGLAVLARAHQIPFYVAAPCSSFDLKLPSGAGIPIEERPAEEITHGFGRPTAPAGIGVWNPAFDVTPAEYIRAIVTEKGLIEPVQREQVQRVVSG